MKQVQMVPVARLMISHRNPRKITQSALDGLKASIQEDTEFLKSRPILVNVRNGHWVIYAGTQRFLACKSLGFTEVPCIVEDNVPQDVLEYRMLADNTHNGEWDEAKLMDQFSKELQDMVWGDEFSGGGEVDISGQRQTKPITYKLTFNDKEDLDRLYILNEELKSQYPTKNISERFLMWMLSIGK